MESPAQLAANRLAWQTESRQAVELKVRTEIEPRGEAAEGAPGFNVIEEDYIETAAGQRFNEFRGLNDGQIVVRNTHFSDGSRFADVDFDPENSEAQQKIFIRGQFWLEDRSDRKQIPKPLLFEYVGHEPLAKALVARSEYLGPVEVMGRTCDQFLFKQVRWAIPQDQVFALDQETSVPLRVEAYRDAAARERKQPMWKWEAESLETVEGHPVATESTETAYGPDGQPSFVWRHHVESIAFDKPYEASTFWPTFQEGVPVLDAITGKVENLTKTDRGVPAVKPTVATEGARPIEAVPPTNWSGPVVFGLGIAVLAVALVLRWRAR